MVEVGGFGVVVVGGRVWLCVYDLYSCVTCAFPGRK